MELGKFNTLKANRRTDNGVYLIDDKNQEVLLPNKYAEGVEEGDEISVFIYTDSEDRLVATTLTPLIQYYDFACLKVKDVNRYGAFLDWGLEKDLLVPFSEQKTRMEEGRWYVVFLYLDEQTNRLVASGKVEDFFERENITVAEGDEVDLLVYNKTDLGFNVVVNNMHTGLLHHSDVFRILSRGDKLKGYIKKIREDDKLDVVLQKPGASSIEPNAEKILNLLKENEGFIGLTDKSSADEIASELEMSKKSFKKALGTLYKKKLVRLEEQGTYLCE